MIYYGYEWKLLDLLIQPAIHGIKSVLVLCCSCHHTGCYYHRPSVWPYNKSISGVLWQRVPGRNVTPNVNCTIMIIRTPYRFIKLPLWPMLWHWRGGGGGIFGYITPAHVPQFQLSFWQTMIYMQQDRVSPVRLLHLLLSLFTLILQDISNIKIPWCQII